MRRRRESGYALLLIFLMAAVIAISLYMELPRVAFESQRQKEQLLVERGEQYKRGLQVFFNTNKRWPAKIEDLENFNNRRFLRKRYKDPMTGKEEWRIIHIANGVLTDSKVNKLNPNGPQGQQSSTAGQYVGEQAGIGQAPVNTGAGAAGGVAMATRRRASDGTAPGSGAYVDPGQGGGPETPGGQPMPGTPQQPGVAVGQQYPGAPMSQQPGVTGQQYTGMQQPGYPPGIPQQGTLPPGVPGMPGQMSPAQIIRGRVYNPQQGAPGNTGSTQSGSYVGGGGAYVGGGVAIGSQSTTVQAVPYPQTGAYPAQQQPYPGQPVNSQYGGVSPTPYPTTPGSAGVTPGYQQPGINTQQIQQASGAAQDMINRAIFGPRPGGAPQGVVGGGAVMGGGIAGFASNADAESIMIYNDRTNYGEWEFVFDPAKQKVPVNPLSGGTGTPVKQVAELPGGNGAGTFAGGTGGGMGTGGTGFSGGSYGGAQAGQPSGIGYGGVGVPAAVLKPDPGYNGELGPRPGSNGLPNAGLGVNPIRQ